MFNMSSSTTITITQNICFIFLYVSGTPLRKNEPLWAAVRYNRDKCMFFSFFIKHSMCHERPSEFWGSRQQRVFLMHSVKYKFWRQQVENQTMCREGGAGVWSPRALEMAGSLKCTTAQLHISFDCRFVVCAGRCFELPLKMKANLVHSVSTADRCCCLFASGTIKGCQTIIYSIDLNHAGLNVMYNLSYNTSQDTTSS